MEIVDKHERVRQFNIALMNLQEECPLTEPWVISKNND